MIEERFDALRFLLDTLRKMEQEPGVTRVYVHGRNKHTGEPLAVEEAVFRLEELLPEIEMALEAVADHTGFVRTVRRCLQGDE